MSAHGHWVQNPVQPTFWDLSFHTGGVCPQGDSPSPAYHQEPLPWRHTTQHNTTQHNTTQHNTTQHNTTQHNTTQHNTTQHNTTQHNTTQHNTTQHNTTQHNTTQHNTTQHNTTQHNTTQHTTTAGLSDCLPRGEGTHGTSQEWACNSDCLKKKSKQLFWVIKQRFPTMSWYVAAGRNMLGHSLCPNIWLGCPPVHETKAQE